MKFLLVLTRLLASVAPALSTSRRLSSASSSSSSSSSDSSPPALPPCEATCFDLKTSTDCFTTFDNGFPVNLDNDPVTLEPAREVSVEVWAKDVTSDGGYIVAKGAQGCNSASYFLYLTGRELHFGVLVGTAWTSVKLIDATSVLSVDGWHHIVGTYDAASTSLKLYVDGNEVASGSKSGNIEYVTGMHHGNLVIGGYLCNLSVQGCDACYEDARLVAGISRVCTWTRALIPLEISSVFNSYALPSSSSLCPEPSCA